MPQGYGFKVGGDAILGPQLHDPQPQRRATAARSTSPGRSTGCPRRRRRAPTSSTPSIQWLDVAGAPQIYPVFDAEKAFDSNGDGQFVFPDEVSTDPSQPGYEERENISQARAWTLPTSGATLVFGAGHLHPGGMAVDLQVARDGPDAGTVDGDDPPRSRPLFRSDAHYYEPAGAVSWDVSMEATRRDWRITLEGGRHGLDQRRPTTSARRPGTSRWGSCPLAWTRADDPLAKDPFDDAAAVKAMYDAGGILTHGRLPREHRHKARKNLKPRRPARPSSAAGDRPRRRASAIDSFLYRNGGFSAIARLPELGDAPADDQRRRVRHLHQPGRAPRHARRASRSGTASPPARRPVTRGSGIGYPLARGPINFDSGQLGFGTGPAPRSRPARPVHDAAADQGRQARYTYFCRIHPFMRGSIRVKGEPSSQRSRPNC